MLMGVLEGPRPAATGWTGPVTNLTHRWPMDDANVSGTTITDVVGSLNGTAQNGVASAAGPITQARSFDGTDDYISLASCPITFASAWSIGAWAYFTNPAATAGDGGAQTFINFGDGSATIRMLTDANTTPAATWDNGDYINKDTNAAAFVATTWAHVCITFDGASTYVLYVNGASASTNSGLSNATNAASNVFGGRAVGARLMTGRLYQVVTYSKALTSGEVSTLYAAQ